jgi:polo-like kinase 1
MGRNPIPKYIPSSTLAVPPSNSYLKQYETSPVADKIRKSMHSQRNSFGSRTSEDLRNFFGKEEDKNSNIEDKDIISRDTGNSSSSRKIAISSLYNNVETGTKIWVKKWVDYSSKYGVGYCLSNGDCGVYFNDSSKIICEPSGKFLFIYKKHGQTDDAIERYSLGNYPKDLAKKITLLEHFRKYLVVEKAVESGEMEVVYLKKWLMTEHAVVFRLSNRVVQARFVDKSELLMSNVEKTVVFIDKNGKQEVCQLKSVKDSNSVELVKRLNYMTEMISSMLNSK